MTRLNKYLAECGICSRRNADKLIEEGRVCVNGQKAVNGMQVCDRDIIEVNGRKVKTISAKVVLATISRSGLSARRKTGMRKGQSPKR